jgi:hypothetical protein
MHQKVDVLILLIYVPKKSSFEIFKFDHSLVFSILHHLFPKKKLIETCYNNISLPWALALFSFFFTRAPLLPLSLQILLVHVSG